ncbi:MAG: hypothetical protein ACRBK7_25475 [Acidimicrobiales bacterium]
MMKPSPAELLQGVADALVDTVLPTLERGPARNQVQAAVGIVQRCASAVDRYGPILHAECSDLLATLRSVLSADPGLTPEEAVGGHSLDSALAKAEAVLGQPYPAISELREIGLELRDQLAQMAVRAERQQSAELPVIRELFDRMTDREQELGLSPW